MLKHRSSLRKSLLPCRRVLLPTQLRIRLSPGGHFFRRARKEARSTCNSEAVPLSFKLDSRSGARETGVEEASRSRARQIAPPVGIGGRERLLGALLRLFVAPGLERWSLVQLFLSSRRSRHPRVDEVHRIALKNGEQLAPVPPSHRYAGTAGGRSGQGGSFEERQPVEILRPFFILRIVRPRIFESKFRNYRAKKLDGALRKSISSV